MIYSLNAWWEKQGIDGKQERKRKRQTHVPVNHWQKTQDKSAAFLAHCEQLKATAIDLRDMRHV